MSNFVKSNEERWIDALATIVAAILAGSTDRIYSAHARDTMNAVDTLLAKAAEDGDDRLRKSLQESRDRLERLIPHR